MLPLNARKVRIIQAIVNDYVNTTRPVGSERLIEMVQLGCKSATVRNEMAELSELGYLVQPHTSAGRIPTDRGYRYYVDALMNPPGALDSEEIRRARRHTRRDTTEIDDILVQTCRMLSSLTSYTSIATDPATEATTVRRVYLTEAGARHILLVLLLSTGDVQHRLVELDAQPGESVLNRLSNYVHSAVADHELNDIGKVLRGLDVPHELAAQSGILMKVFAALLQMAAGLSERRVFLEGTSQLLRQPEFQDVQRLETLLSALESRKMLYDVLSRTSEGDEVQIVIGTENQYASMQECSVITTTYRIGARPAGFLGVVGPTRMNYDRAVAAVEFMASSLSQMLTNLSVA